MPPTRPSGRLGALRETSAGGLVVRGSGADAVAALIARRDRRGRLEWVLPKGHLEIGETAEQAALREVFEETGVAAEVVGRLGTITYSFVADRRRIRKQVHHFAMRYVSGRLSDADPEAVAVAWVPLAEVVDRLRYDSERELALRLPAVLATAHPAPGPMGTPPRPGTPISAGPGPRGGPGPADTA
jgi:8-oxo-dGTP pyrophosphatase MutT (NUDIX family)